MWQTWSSFNVSLERKLVNLVEDIADEDERVVEGEDSGDNDEAKYTQEDGERVSCIV